MSITDTLTEKVGPFPAIVWGGIAVGGYLAFRTLSARQTANSQPPTEVPAEDFSGTGISGVDAVDDTGGAVTTVNGSPAITSNVQWARVVADELISQGANPILVETAIAKYLEGSTLSTSEQSIIDKALTLFGSPPEGVIPVTVSPPPTAPPTQPVTPTPVPKPVPKPAPKPAPKPQRTYTVRSGDSLWKISERFYGTGLDWPRIYNANRNIIHNPNLIFAGQVLVIP